MGIYKQLSIKDGGGIIDRDRLAEKTKDSVLIIGLGGTGGDTVAALKKKVYRYLKPDNPDDIAPTYSNIRYLAIDADPYNYREKKEEPWEVDGTKEFFDISSHTLPEELYNWSLLEANPALTWLSYEKLGVRTAQCGAGGIRQVGRYELIKYVERLYDRLTTEIKRITEYSDYGHLKVCICTGLGGGTGSGIFLDVCYLVQLAIDETLGYRNSNAEVIGYCFLPDVNLCMPGIMGNPPHEAYIKENAYAALKELDYCMNFSHNQDSFKMNYGFRTIDNSNPPVDICYLVSAIDQVGSQVRDGYHYAIDMAAESILEILVRDPYADEEGLALAPHIAGIKPMHLRFQSGDGACHNYQMLGVCSAVLPTNDILTYLGTKLFEGSKEVLQRVPTKAERDSFLVEVGLKYDDIVCAMMEECTTSLIFPEEFCHGKFLRENGADPYLNVYHDTLERSKAIHKSNAKAMQEDLASYRLDEDNKCTSFINRIYKALCETFVFHFEYGPFYAKRMLYGINNEDLYKAVLGLIEVNRERIKSEMIHEEHLAESLEAEKVRAVNANFLNAQMRLNTFTETLNQYYGHKCRWHAYESLDKVLVTLRDQLAQLDRNFFSVYTDILDNLYSTFGENEKWLQHGWGNNEPVVWKLLDAGTVACLSEEVMKEKDIPHIANHLIQTIHEQMPCRNREDEERWISKIVTDFIVHEFGAETNKSMGAYLRIRFDTNDFAVLSHAIGQEVMKRLYDGACPLIWQKPGCGSNHIKKAHVTIPYNETVVENAADTIRDLYDVLVRKKMCPNRISVSRGIIGVALHELNGMIEWGKVYSFCRISGLHLYEKEPNWRKWLPPITPYSFASEDDCEYEIIREGAHLWEEARLNGIIDQTEDGKFYIRVADNSAWKAQYEAFKEDYAEYVEKFIPLVVNGEATRRRREATSKICEEGGNLLNQSYFDNKVDQVVVGYGDETICMDIFVQSPKLVNLVREENEKIIQDKEDRDHIKELFISITF